MEPTIKAQYSPQIVEDAVARYAVDRATLQPLDGFESYIYECRRAGQACILRISHDLHRNAQAIAGEIDWVNYLADNGVDACRALPSVDGNLVEPLDSGFTAALFMKAPGTHSSAEIWQPPLFESMGQLMGRMHALAKTYRPADPVIRRPDWDTDIIGLAEKFIPDQPRIIEKFNANIAATRALPRNRDNYGLIHIDFHGGNFFVDDGRIYIFDFDDSQYSWFADDIAMCLFYAVSHDCSSVEELAHARTFLRHFLTGYARENEIGRNELANIPFFLKRREVDLYTIIHRSQDMNNLDGWSSSFMTRRAEKILNDVPYIDLDFTQI